ncbi:MAG: DNRLRE domain-containing protein, partial [Clostridia bacterium]
MECKDYEVEANDMLDCDVIDPAQREAEPIPFESLDGTEIPSLRTENAKQFDLGENRYQAIVFPEAVHYQVNGQWQEIDNNLDEGESGRRKVLRNRANALMCELPVTANNESLVQLTSDDQVLKWAFEQPVRQVRAEVTNGAALRRERLVALAKESPQYAGRGADSFSQEELAALETPEEKRFDLTERSARVLYRGVLPGVDVRYTLSGDQLKEDIICMNRDAVSRATIKLPSAYDYAVQADKSLIVRDKDSGAEHFYFDMPVVYDCTGATTIARPVLTPMDGYVRLHYEIDEDFLAVAAYPLTIDPVAKQRTNNEGVTAFYLNMKEDVSRAASTKQLRVGKNGSGKTHATVMKFAMLPRLKASDTVVSAKLRLSCVPSKSKGHFVGAYEINAPWDAQNAKWGDIKEHVSAKPFDFATGGFGTMTFDLTNQYRRWYLAEGGVGQNNGILLKCIPETQKYFAFGGPGHQTKSKRPLMTINYVSHAGVQSWWKVETQSAGRAGAMNVDLFNGSVIHQHVDTAMSGSRLPVGITHTYNSCQSAPDSYYRTVPEDDKSNDPGSYEAMYRLGHGWRHSGLQWIYQVNINKKHYFVWVDGSGTEHWFRNDKKSYEVDAHDMEGMGLTLKRYTSTNKLPPRIVIEDKSNTQLVFQRRPEKKHQGTWLHHWLVRVHDNLKKDGKLVNKVEYTYHLPQDMDSSQAMRLLEGKLEKITDPAGRETTFAYAATGGLLSAIETPDYDPTTDQPATRRVEFSYNESGQLAAVNYSDLLACGIAAPHTTYTYAPGTNLLLSAQNYDGTRVCTTYEQLNADIQGFDINENLEDGDAEEITAEGGQSIGDDGANFPCTINYELCRALSLETTKNAVKGAMAQFAYMNSQTVVTIVEGDASAATDKRVFYQFNDQGNVLSVRDELGYAQFARYEAGEGNENKPTEVSKLQRAVVNLLRRPDFGGATETNPVWTLVNPNAYHKITNALGNVAAVDESPSAQCLSLNPIRLKRNSASGDLRAEQEVLLDLGKVYTFSAYVKADDVHSAANLGGSMKIVSSEGAPALSGPQIMENTEDDLEAELPGDGWDRYKAIYDTRGYTGTAKITLSLVNEADSGTVWFAAPQLEDGSVANSANLLSNSDFRLGSENSTYLSVTRTYPLDWTAGKDIDSELKKAGTKAKQDALKLHVREMARQTGIQARDSDPASPMPAALSGQYMQLCDIPRTKAQDISFKQEIESAGKKGEVYFVGGWADGQGMPGSASTGSGVRKRYFGLAVEFYCRPSGKSKFSWYAGKGGKVPFNQEWVGWQAAGSAVAAPYNYAKMRVRIVAKGQLNRARFTNLFLLREEYGKSYQYDKKSRNMVSTTALSGQQRGMEFDKQDNLIRYRKAGRPKNEANKYKLTYHKPLDAHQLKQLTTPENVKTSYAYDDWGNRVKTTRDGTKDIVTETVYDAETRNYAVKQIDARGNIAETAIDANTGLLKAATDPLGTRVTYEYSLRKQLTGVQTAPDAAQPESAYRNEYGYNSEGRLTAIRHNTTGETCDVAYGIEYDELGAQTKVSVGGQVLSENVYAADRGHKLLTSTYGNGATVSNQYDDFDRLTGICYDGATDPRYAYEYGANGQVARVRDTQLRRTHESEYDLALHPKRATITDEDGHILYRATLKYDKLDHLVSLGERVEGDSYRTNFEYDKDDRISQIAYDDENRDDKAIDRGVDYAYSGGLGRLTGKTLSLGQTTDAAGKASVATREVKYGYLDTAGQPKRTTPMIASITQSANGESDLDYAYEYDALGNIVKETRGGAAVSYAYDKLGQLLRVNDPADPTMGDTGTTWTYEYDRGG